MLFPERIFFFGKPITHNFCDIETPISADYIFQIQKSTKWIIQVRVWDKIKFSNLLLVSAKCKKLSHMRSSTHTGINLAIFHNYILCQMFILTICITQSFQLQLLHMQTVWKLLNETFSLKLWFPLQLEQRSLQYFLVFLHYCTPNIWST